MRFIIMFFLFISASWAMDPEDSREKGSTLAVCGEKALTGHTCPYAKHYDSGVFEKPDPNLTLQVSKVYWRDIFTPIDGCGLNAESIYELMNRYSLTGKSIIAFGPGHAREERFFFTYGMSPVVLVDHSDTYLYTDEVKKKRIVEENKDCEILADLDHVYFIHAMQEHASVNPLLKDKFDVAFVSGSTIQEYRNICLKRANPTIEREWPKNQKVFVENVILTSSCLKKSGLLIFQNWASGNVPIGSKNYLTSARNQLENNGIQLLEVYARSRGDEHHVAEHNYNGTDGIHLFIGYRGSKEEALEYYKEIIKNGEIKSIFGSYHYAYPAIYTTKKVYTISEG